MFHTQREKNYTKLLYVTNNYVSATYYLAVFEYFLSNINEWRRASKEPFV